MLSAVMGAAAVVVTVVVLIVIKDAGQSVKDVEEQGGAAVRSEGRRVSVEEG